MTTKIKTTTMSNSIEKQWWKESVIYQIYPRSFRDSNDDGIGDIKGIISKLDYLKLLGVDIIWMSPVYESPNDDNGYDISNYFKIHPEFGTMEDFDELLAGLHERGMKLIMDLVVNHTSDEHEWFEQSKASKDNSYRDYYFWKPGKNGGPPNNWPSFFGGSAWTLDEQTQEYYLHLFTKKQPDLNWENPLVRKQIYKVLKFWLDKGIDGFRMDVIPLISKRLDFADTSLPTFNEIIEKVYSNGPRVHEFINEMYEEVLQHYDIMTVGEGPGITKEVSLDYVGSDRRELNMIFHLDHMYLGCGPLGKFDPLPYSWKDIKKLFIEWDQSIAEKGWISIFLDNHDFPRLVSRFGNDKEYWSESAKLLATLILTLRGTPCIYQGSELGMTNVHFEEMKEYRDVETLNFHDEFVERGMKSEDFLKLVHDYGRDNVRTPMHWDNSKHGGFSKQEPWIKTNPNYPLINAELAVNDTNSIFNFYKELLTYRKLHSTLTYGAFKFEMEDSEELFIYSREDDEQEFCIVLNHSDKECKFQRNLEAFDLEVRNLDHNNLAILKPWEARIYRKKK